MPQAFVCTKAGVGATAEWRLEGWQPIETAPKDGSEVDLGGLDAQGKWERWCCARWDAEAFEWRDGVLAEGAWQGPWSDGYPSSVPTSFTATHWMRPPEPPLENTRHA